MGESNFHSDLSISKVKGAFEKVNKEITEIPSVAEEILRGSFKEGTRIVAKHVKDAEELVFYDEALEIEDSDEKTEKSDTSEK